MISLNFIDDQQINFNQLGMGSSISVGDPVTEEVVIESLELILNKNNFLIKNFIFYNLILKTFYNFN